MFRILESFFKLFQGSASSRAMAHLIRTGNLLSYGRLDSLTISYSETMNKPSESRHFSKHGSAIQICYSRGSQRWKRYEYIAGKRHFILILLMQHFLNSEHCRISPECKALSKDEIIGPLLMSFLKILMYISPR